MTPRALAGRGQVSEVILTSTLTLSLTLIGHIDVTVPNLIPDVIVYAPTLSLTGQLVAKISPS